MSKQRTLQQVFDVVINHNHFTDDRHYSVHYSSEYMCNALKRAVNYGTITPRSATPA